MSMVLLFYRFRGVTGFLVSCVLWFDRIRRVNGFMVS